MGEQRATSSRKDPPMSGAVLDVSAAVLDDVINLRRDFHMHPELGFEDIRTASIVADGIKIPEYDVPSWSGQSGVGGRRGQGCRTG